MNGIWALEPHYLGSWTLRDIQGCMGIRGVRFRDSSEGFRVVGYKPFT